jgi:hypothetical protein
VTTHSPDSWLDVGDSWKRRYDGESVGCGVQGEVKIRLSGRV